jgi:uncharacterized membrane protein
MTPGALYLLGAPLQLSQRIRTRHYTLHRRLGRGLVTAALLSVIFALLFGLRYPWGGLGEAMATAVFSCWFVACLALAVNAIRRGDVINHRRWMIRAFVTGVAVGTSASGSVCSSGPGCSTLTTASPQRFGLRSACT